MDEDTSLVLDESIVYGDDYLAFKRLVSNLLFNHGYHEYVDEMGRNHRHVKSGILRMDMPRALEDVCRLLMDVTSQRSSGISSAAGASGAERGSSKAPTAAKAFS